MRESGAADLRAALQSEALKKFVASGRVVDTKFVDAAALGELAENRELKKEIDESGESGLVVEHERVAFASFPYEWPPEMLRAAGRLTLDLAEGLLDEGLGLKDATPYNVLFRATRPVFVDLSSFERRDASDPVWLPYAQFVRTFLLPLLVNRRFGLRLDELLLANRDGLEPAAVSAMCGPVEKFLPPFLTLATLPTRLASKRTTRRGVERDDEKHSALYRKRDAGNVEKARFILAQQLKSLRRTLDRITPAHAARESKWSNYLGPEQHFSQTYLEEKESFVEEVISELNPRRVLDVGCNTGHFSRLVARHGASEVVAIDGDPVVVGEAWRKADAENLNVLPLVVDLARPSPAVGWRNAECASFLERARGHFDLVLMLAVAHHLIVGERVPPAEVLNLAADLTAGFAVVEFVGTDDPMFRQLARGRDALYEYFTRGYFERACQERFEIARTRRLADTGRYLYLLKKRGGGGETRA